MLYDAINKSNNTNREILTEIKKISNQNDKIVKSSAVTAYNSTITAYNSGITAQNAEYLKWYTFFKG